MTASVVDTILVVLTFSFILLAVVVWSSVFKNLLEPLNITPGVYTLLLIIIAAIALWAYSRSNPTPDQPIMKNFWFILVAAIVFMAAVSVANLLESWAKPWFGNFTDSKAWNDFWYAVVITIIVSLILVAMSKYAKPSYQTSTSNRGSPRRGLQEVTGKLPGERVADLAPLAGYNRESSSYRGMMGGRRAAFN